MLLISLMGMSPRFWMPERHGRSSRQSASITMFAIPRSARVDYRTMTGTSVACPGIGPCFGAPNWSVRLPGVVGVNSTS